MTARATPTRAPASRRKRTVFLLVQVALALLVAGDARAVFFAPRFLPPSVFDLKPIEDQLEIVVRERELIAIDAWSGGSILAEIELGEHVIWKGVRGRVAIVVTDRRLLGVVPGAIAWSERGIGVNESSPLRAVLGDRVALLVTDRRVLGFEGISGSWSETWLKRREQVLSVGAGTNVAVAVTRTRALGVAAVAGGLFEAELHVRENVDSVSVHGSFATVATRLRLLTFHAPDGNWQETGLSLR